MIAHLFLILIGLGLAVLGDEVVESEGIGALVSLSGFVVAVVGLLGLIVELAT